MLFEKDYIKALPRYSVSKTQDDVCAEYNLTNAVYLASNENPYGCSPAVMESIRSVDNLHRYPDGDGREPKKCLSNLLGCKQQNIILGNGSNEILESAAKAYVSDQDRVLISEHSFAMYSILGRLFGGCIDQVPMNDWQVDLTAMLAAVTDRTRLIYLSSINNPTGTGIDRSRLLDFLQQLPADVLVVLDEAYIEFADKAQSLCKDINQFPNLIVSRTFSKAYGLAGFRVGYGVANSELISVLEKVRQPFNLNVLAQNAAIAAINDRDFVDMTISNNLQQRHQIQDFLKSCGYRVLESDANFLCYQVGSLAHEHYQFLLKSGVIIRPLKAYNMNEWLRVSVGTRQENDLFMDAVNQWIDSNNNE